MSIVFNIILLDLPNKQSLLFLKFTIVHPVFVKLPCICNMSSLNKKKNKFASPTFVLSALVALMRVRNVWANSPRLGPVLNWSTPSSFSFLSWPSFFLPSFLFSPSFISSPSSSFFALLGAELRKIESLVRFLLNLMGKNQNPFVIVNQHRRVLVIFFS